MLILLILFSLCFHIACSLHPSSTCRAIQKQALSHCKDGEISPSASTVQQREARCQKLYAGQMLEFQNENYLNSPG